MHRMLVHNQKHLHRNLANQTAQKVQHRLGIKVLAKQLEVQLAPITNGGDEIAAKPLSHPWHNWSLSLLAIGATHLVISAQPHLIPPMNLRPLLFRQLDYGRVIRL